MITGFDIVLACLVGLAFTFSKQPKRLAVGLCVFGLISIIALDYLMTGVDFYWMAFGLEAAIALILWGCANDLRRYTDRMYYRALSSFLVCSCVVTGLYIYDVWLYSDHALYVTTSRWVGITHALFMVAFSDSVIGSGVYSKGVAFIDRFLDGSRHHS